MHDLLIEPVASGVESVGISLQDASDILTPQAMEFVIALERKFRSERFALLERRAERQEQLDNGVMPQFLSSTEAIRNDQAWRVGTVPADLQNRRVEITGPVDRKMMINALNSGANVFMADFEDANSPTWTNVLQGQRNLRDAIRRQISFSSPEGKKYRLNEIVATLLVRPRGWHLSEKHFRLDGEPISASIFDFGLYFFHNCQELLNRGTGPYFYLPKLENHLEARLWNDVILTAESMIGVPVGTVKVTVLIETILAAFEMEEILFELRDHIVGLNAGRWDYLFSIIKKFRNKPDLLMPDRSQLTMTVPFMRAYTDLLVKTCHRRGAHAIGGMAAFIPNKRDPEVTATALSKVKEDKVRESADGFDGTWIAHPDLVSVARKPFDEVLGTSPHQKHKLREDVHVSADDLLNFAIPGATISEKGMRNNINVGLQYIESWLRGTGAAGIFNLMEDVATAEIARSQIWQWLHHPHATLTDGRRITEELYREFAAQELLAIESSVGVEQFSASRFDVARLIFDLVATRDGFTEFLTLEAYKYLD